MTWKQSFTCQVSSFISLISLMGSPITLFVMMFSKFCVIQWPMNSTFKCKKFCSRTILSVIITIICYCFIMTCTFTSVLNNQFPNGMCILLYKKGQLSEFITFISLVIIFVQIFCFISNVTLNILSIYTLMIKNRSTVPNSCEKKKKHKQIVIHFLIVIFTNMCCWIPSTISFILPLTGYQMPSIILVWILIAVVPINSVINPILFSILTPNMVRLFSSIWNN